MTSRDRPFRTRFKFLALLLSAVFSFLLLEIAVRLFVDFSLYKPQRIGDVNFETELSFIPGRERVYDTPEYHVTVSINRFGRRDREWTTEMFGDAGNILFVGDSFVFGIGADHEATIPSRLEAIGAAAGRELEVFNFGMPRTAIAQYKLNLEEAFKVGIEASTVIVGVFVGNDFDPESLPDRKAKERTKVAVVDKQVKRSLWPRSRLVHYVAMRVSHSPILTSAILRLDRLLGLRLYDTSSSYIFFRHQTPEQIANFQEMLGYLGEIDELCQENGRDLLVVILPNKIQVENRDDLMSSSYEAEKPNRLVAEYCAERGISHLDMLPVLAAEHARIGTELYYPIDRHLTVDGYRIAAQAIADYIKITEITDSNALPHRGAISD